MRAKFLLFTVPLVLVLGFAWGIALVNSSNNSVVDVVQPVGDHPYFPTEPLTDEQGAVSIDVTQLNLNGPGETLDFQIALNTHSVDLSMDLASVATLTTETGQTITPLAWDAPRGGHHVSGVLSFPSVVDGEDVLDGATEVSLTIRGVDAPERIFVWKLRA